MAEILDKENSKSNARNSRKSPDRRVSLDGRQSILPHFRTSFASTGGKYNSSNNGRLISLPNPQTVLPLSQNCTDPEKKSTGDASNSRKAVERPRLSDNGGNSRRSFFPHYRKSFVSCKFGGSSRINSTRKSSSSKERIDVVPQNQTSLSRNSERKSTSNFQGSILPHYRTSFYSCTSSVGYPRSSTTGKIQSPNNEKNVVEIHQSSVSSERNSTGMQICSHSKEQAHLPLHLRTHTGSCHDSCKDGVMELYEEKSRTSVTKRNNPLPSPNHNNNRRAKNSSKPNYSSDSEIQVPKSKNSKQEISNPSKKRSSSANSRPTRENPYISPEVSKQLSAKRNKVTDTTMSSSPENEVQSQIPAKIIQCPSPLLSTSTTSLFTSEDDFSGSDDFEYEYEYSDSECSDDDESVVSESSDIIVPDKPRKRTTSKVIHYVQNGDSPPVKLIFRRGRIIEIEKNDQNGPRRLRFRKAKVLESKEDGKTNGRIRIYRKRSDNGRIEKHRSSPKHEKVSLKHQDVEEKKDLQILLNNVIEETATRLAESRRSKVKALVGAFETVFSAVDTPPATPTVPS